MEVTNKLMNEHQLILRFASLLETRLVNADALAQSSNADRFWLDLKDISQFIKQYADDYHHAKEENVLFHFMSRPDILSHCNPISQMMYEHDMGRDYVKNLILAIEGRDVKGAQNNGLGWVQLLRAHIYKEDNILYRMAEQAIPENTKQDIQSEYDVIEKERNSTELQSHFELLEERLSLIQNSQVPQSL